MIDNLQNQVIFFTSNEKYTFQYYEKLAFLGAASVEHIELVHKAFYLMCVLHYKT